MRWMMVIPFPWCKNDDVRSRGSSGTPELTEEDYDVWDIWSLFRWLERMNRDGMSPGAWTEAYLSRKGYGDGDRSQHELQCTARVLGVALPYDELNI